MDQYILQRIIGYLDDPNDIMSMLQVSHHFYDATKFMLEHGNFNKLRLEDIHRIVDKYKNDNPFMKEKRMTIPLSFWLGKGFSLATPVIALRLDDNIRLDFQLRDLNDVY
jgi:hypothetical protein